MSTYYDELLHGLFTTALEGGIGYWSTCSEYHWSKGDGLGDDDYEGFYAIIEDDESMPEDPDDYECNPLRIDKKTMKMGYELARTTWRNKVSWSSEKPPFIPSADNDWDYDAGDADVIVQLGLFGEVLYG